jgi:hypothetical protein
VVCDKAGHRTWYSDLAGIPDELGGLDIQPLAACAARILSYAV